jgi:hypothetical protein
VPEDAEHGHDVVMHHGPGGDKVQRTRIRLSVENMVASAVGHGVTRDQRTIDRIDSPLCTASTQPACACGAPQPVRPRCSSSPPSASSTVVLFSLSTGVAVNFRTSSVDACVHRYTVVDPLVTSAPSPRLFGSRGLVGADLTHRPPFPLSVAAGGHRASSSSRYGPD